MTPEQKSLRAQLAATKRHHPEDTAAVSKIKAALSASRFETYVEETVASMPSLAPESRVRLALLLLGGAA